MTSTGEKKLQSSSIEEMLCFALSENSSFNLRGRELISLFIPSKTISADKAETVTLWGSLEYWSLDKTIFFFRKAIRLINVYDYKLMKDLH